MKLYLIVVLAVVFLGVMAGGILPCLFSAKSTSAVMAGVGGLLLMPLVLWKLYRMAMREIESKESPHEKDRGAKNGNDEEGTGRLD